ncbi:MAG: DinB family protein [Mucilaginibacter sp.]|nr:DinB family protein [Mucilaginibacter sp.]
MKNDLQTTIAHTKDELLKALDLFNQGNINAIPFEGSWTGGQVAEHVLKSVSGIAQTLNGPSKTTERNPEEHIKMFGEVFLNMNIKMKSPDFIIPSDSPKDKTVLHSSLEKAFDGIEDAAEKNNLTETCTTFEMPTIGLITRIEWIHFACFHTKRHTQQLKNIAHHLNIAEIEQD